MKSNDAVFTTRTSNCISIDYSFNYAGKYKLENGDGEWIERTPGHCRISQHESAYLTDMRTLSSPAHLAFIALRGTEDENPFLAHLKTPENCNPMVFNDKSGEIGTCFREIFTLGKKRGERGYWQVQSCLYRIIDELYSLSTAPSAGRCPRETSLSEQVNGYFTQNLQSRISLQELAETFFVSPSSLSHIYKKETNMAPMKHFMNLRMEYVKELLSKGLSIKEIAYECDFSSPNRLSHIFKVQTGITPRDFLKRFAENYSSSTSIL